MEGPSVTHPNRLPDEHVQITPSSVFVVVHLLPILAIFTGVSFRDWMLLLVTYWVRMFFITAGYHRYFAHRAYSTNRVFQFILAFGGSSAAQKGPLWWAGNHRLHHRHTDTIRDVHSPITRSFWYSHFGWIFDGNDETRWDKVQDFAKYPELVWLDRHWLVPPVALAVGCLWFAGLPGLFLGFFATTVNANTGGALTTTQLANQRTAINAGSFRFGVRRTFEELGIRDEEIRRET